MLNRFYGLWPLVCRGIFESYCHWACDLKHCQEHILKLSSTLTKHLNLRCPYVVCQAFCPLYSFFMPQCSVISQFTMQKHKSDKVMTTCQEANKMRGMKRDMFQEDWSITCSSAQIICVYDGNHSTELCRGLWCASCIHCLVQMWKNKTKLTFLFCIKLRWCLT